MISDNLYDRQALSLGQPTSLSKLLPFMLNANCILDVGCATGKLGEYLQQHTHCVVDAIEANEASAIAAKPFYRQLFMIDLESYDQYEEIDTKYDVIVLADVLEHLREPEKVLTLLAQKLTEKGRFLISLPNVGHASVILQLLQSQFVYQQHGLLDKTHVRFFNHQNLAQLFEGASLGYWQLVDRVVIGTQGTEFSDLLTNSISPNWLPILAAIPESNTYQFLLEASPYNVLTAQNTKSDLAKLNAIPQGIFFYSVMHYLTHAQPTQYQAISSLCDINSACFNLSFRLTEEATSIRFDPTDMAGIVRLSSCLALDEQGNEVWRLLPSAMISQHSHAFSMQWSESEQYWVLEMRSADPWFMLPIPQELMPQVREIKVEMTWPRSFDFWLLDQAWTNKVEQLKGQNEQQLQLLDQLVNELDTNKAQLLACQTELTQWQKSFCSLFKKMVIKQ